MEAMSGAFIEPRSHRSVLGGFIGVLVDNVNSNTPDQLKDTGYSASDTWCASEQSKFGRCAARV